MRHALWSILIAVLIATSSPAKDKLAADLANRSATERIDVIVQFRKAQNADLFGRFRQRIVARMAKYAGIDKGDLSLVQGLSLNLPASALEELAADVDVEFISPDRPVNGALDRTVSAVGGDIVSAAGLDGTGIGIAIIDSGMTLNAEDIQSQIVYSESFVPGDAGVIDKYGHGTHVAGIIGSSGKKSNYLWVGLAPKAQFINLRALDQYGQGTDSSVIAAIQRAIELKSRFNIRVINLSLGRPVFESYKTDPLCRAVEAAWNAGIVVVVAAGNYGRLNDLGNQGYGTIASPGNDPYVITVGAMSSNDTPSRYDDTITSYSSKGPSIIDHVVKPDLVAPGNRVISMNTTGSSKLYSYYPKNKISSFYFRLSGTSMATPVVSGAAALLLQKEPRLTPDQVKARLMKTAYKVFPSSSTTTDPVTGQTFRAQYDLFTVGAGYLDIAAAIANKDTAPVGTRAISPTVLYDSATGTVKVMGGDLPAGSTLLWGSSPVWANSLIWGTTVLWGETVTYSNSVLWGSTVLWGSNAPWGASNSAGFSVLWGTNGVSGSTVLWGSDASRESGALDAMLQGDN